MERQTHHYLHIPKTGGTALKYTVDDHNSANKPNPKILMPKAGHNQHLSRMGSNVCFAIRHPWERFCSGFWERATMEKRRELSKTKYKDVPGFGYKDYTPLEKEIFEKCKTPDQYLTYIKDGGKTAGVTPGLFELTASMTNWTGNMETFKQNQGRIAMVFHINQLDSVMKTVYNLELPKDPFRKRSRALFDQTQSYSISPANRIWFEREFRKDDYELIAYIKTQPFFYST
jgi:hypothetical protein